MIPMPMDATVALIVELAKMGILAGVLVYAVKVEHRLTRLETILDRRRMLRAEQSHGDPG